MILLVPKTHSKIKIKFILLTDSRLYKKLRQIKMFPSHLWIDARGIQQPPLRCNSFRPQHAPAMQGEALVASTGWDVGAFTLLSG
jgi:hypothetical protein